MLANRQWTFAQHFEGDVSPAHFTFGNGSVPELKSNEFLARNVFISIHGV